MDKYLPEIIQKARDLRQRNFSLQEISKILKIPSNSIRQWCYGLYINPHTSLRINNDFRRKLLKQQDYEIIPLAINLTADQSRFLCALLYGCEGSKYPASNLVAFVNSDPGLIKTFTDLFRKSFKLDENKFRIHLQIHDYHDISELKMYWSKLLKIPLGQFLKPTITSPRGKMRRQNYLGTCTLRYLDTKIQLRLLGIFELFCNQGEVA